MPTRFLSAQKQYPYSHILRELQSGRKAGHWIWFVFPQLKGMGRSYNAEYYGIKNLAEARAYWADPVLGARLRECLEALLEHAHADIWMIMGSDIDALKLKSSMTLFLAAAPEEELFSEVLETFYAGEQCSLTLEKLQQPGF
jgi:uncharacterized protein (DUF1810 family)